MTRKEIQLKWNDANRRADQANKSIADLRALGIGDTTAPLLAELEQTLDQANAELDRLEFEADDA